MEEKLQLQVVNLTLEVEEKYFERTIQKTIQKDEKTIQKKTTSLQNSVMEYLSTHPEATQRELTENVYGATLGGVKYTLARLLELGLLKRVGGRKEGHWEVVKSSDE